MYSIRLTGAPCIIEFLNFVFLFCVCFVGDTKYTLLFLKDMRDTFFFFALF